MSYPDRKHTNHRTATIIAVTAIEALSIFAVVRGLTVEFTRNPAPVPLEAGQIRLDPTPRILPKPHPTPSAQPSHRPDQAIHNRDNRGTAGPILIIDPQPMPSASPMPQPPPDTFIEPPRTPHFAPRAARSLGNPGSWATSNDYPARDLREGNQGVAGFRLTIGSNGKVQECTITASSGFPGLDRATCDNLTRRARFEPATDGSGAKVAGTYSNNIRWVIPD